jgi:hypothetical protein
LVVLIKEGSSLCRHRLAKPLEDVSALAGLVVAAAGAVDAIVVFAWPEPLFAMAAFDLSLLYGRVHHRRGSIGGDGDIGRLAAAEEDLADAAQALVLVGDGVVLPAALVAIDEHLDGAPVDVPASIAEGGGVGVARHCAGEK